MSGRGRCWSGVRGGSGAGGAGPGVTPVPGGCGVRVGHLPASTSSWHAAAQPPGPPSMPPVPTGATVGGVTVRQATAADVEPMAAQLCRAFADDPVMAYVFRNEGRRTKAMRAYFTSQMRGDYLPFGGCYTTDDHLGAAVWGPAGKPLLTGIAGLANLLRVFPYVWTHSKSTLEMISLIESNHPHEPHWYLATPRDRSRGPGPRHRIGADAPRPGPLRRRRVAGLPGVVEGAQHPLLRPPRVRGGQGAAAPARGPEHLDHVEGAAGAPDAAGGGAGRCRRRRRRDGGVVRWGGCPRAWPGGRRLPARERR